MKIFIEKEETIKIDESTKLELLNVTDFISKIKKESDSVPIGHIKVSLKYKLINNDNEYFGESIFDSYKGVSNVIDDNSPYKVELVDWKLSDNEEKYFEFNVDKVQNDSIKLENNSDLLEYWKNNEFKNEFDNNIVLDYLKTNDDNAKLCTDAIQDYQFDLVKLIIENSSIDVLPKEYNDFYGKSTRYHYSCGLYGLLCYLSIDEPEIKDYLCRQNSVYNFIRYLKSKGFESSNNVSIKKEYWGGIKHTSRFNKDYTSHLNRVLNKISKLDFAKKVLGSIDEIVIEITKDEEKITFSNSITSMHGIDTYLKITKISPELYEEFKNKEKIREIITPEIEEIKSELDLLKFDNYIISTYNNEVIVHDFFIEEGDYSLEYVKWIDW